VSAVVLASGSPRRRELLARLGVEFQVVVPDVDETPLAGEAPGEYVARLARAKAAAVVVEAGTLVIAADTTVDVDGEILGKPADIDQARRMLKRLSGRTHHVHTGVAVRRDGRIEYSVEDTRVQFEALTDHALEWYLATGESFDKAGAYALQGAGGVFVSKISGSVSNVIGLPLHTVVELARRVGVDLVGAPSSTAETPSRPVSD
jgi:septum formation protein